MCVITTTKSNTMKKRKITRKRWTTEEVAKLKSLVKKGKSNRQIALALDRTPLSIYQARAKHGLPRGLSNSYEFAPIPQHKNKNKIYWSTLS